MTNRDSIPVEIRLIKFPPRHIDNRCNIKRYLEYLKERYKNQYAYKNEPKIITFRCYGWFDYLLLIFHPHIRCLENLGREIRGDDNCGVMTTSFVLWTSKDINSSDGNQRCKYYQLIDKIYDNLLNLSKNRNDSNPTENGYANNDDLLGCIKSVIFNDSHRCLDNYLINLGESEGNIYPKFYASGLDEDGKTENELCYIMSFIKLKENEENNTPNSRVDDNGNSKILNDFIIFDYLGIWDIVVLASLEYKDLKNYKNKFLVNESLPIAQTSSIILIPVTKREIENNIE